MQSFNEYKQADLISAQRESVRSRALLLTCNRRPVKHKYQQKIQELIL